ncbi:MAG: hypothetical protein AAB851_02715, partial [Patescibacteria group bacterium]
GLKKDEAKILLFKNLEEEAGKRTVVFYESPHRILKSLQSLAENSPAAEIAVCRELTKKFETTYRGTPEKVMEKLKSDKILGEFVVVVRKPQLGNSVSK